MPRSSVRVRVILGSSLAVAMVLPSPGGSAQGDGSTNAISVDPQGRTGTGHSGSPTISRDGRVVAFSSQASDLVAGDANGFQDVFVRDATTATTQRISVPNSGGEADNHSHSPSLSSSGRFVVFTSEATSLAEGGQPQGLYVKDLQTGTLEAVPFPQFGTSQGASDPSISDDGRYIAFVTYTGLVPEDDQTDLDVYVVDRADGSFIAVTTKRGEHGSISADGNFVVFETSDALVGSDVNDKRDVYRFDIRTRAYDLVSVGSSGQQGDETSNNAAISADGRFVSFRSKANNLVADDGNSSDVFLRDLVQGTTIRVSVDLQGGQSNGESDFSSVSDDGRFIAFTSSSTDIAAGDDNGTVDIFVRDVTEGITHVASISTGEDFGDGNSGNPPSISGDGKFVAFSSEASNLVVGDQNGSVDVFLRELGEGIPAGGSVETLLSIRYDSASTSFKGRVTASEGCSARRKVVVKSSADKSVVGRATSGRSGGWSLAASPRPGRYFAATPRKELSGGVSCSKARSDEVRVR